MVTLRWGAGPGATQAWMSPASYASPPSGLGCETHRWGCIPRTHVISPGEGERRVRSPSRFVVLRPVHPGDRLGDRLWARQPRTRGPQLERLVAIADVADV